MLSLHKNLYCRRIIKKEMGHIKDVDREKAVYKKLTIKDKKQNLSMEGVLSFKMQQNAYCSGRICP